MGTVSQSLITFELSGHNWDKHNGGAGWGGGLKVFEQPGGICRKVIQILQGKWDIQLWELKKR